MVQHKSHETEFIHVKTLLLLLCFKIIYLILLEGLTAELDSVPIGRGLGTLVQSEKCQLWQIYDNQRKCLIHFKILLKIIDLLILAYCPVLHTMLYLLHCFKVLVKLHIICQSYAPNTFPWQCQTIIVKIILGQRTD